MFRRVLYRREGRAATCLGESKFFIFFLVLQSRKRLAEPHPWFQVIISHFDELEVCKLKTWSMSIEQKMCERNILLCCPEKQRMTVKWFNWSLKICPKYQAWSSYYLTFWNRWLVQWAVSKNCAKRKYFNSNLCPKLYHVSIEGSQSRILVHLVWRTLTSNLYLALN